jgi:hypothetical protein
VGQGGYQRDSANDVAEERWDKETRYVAKERDFSKRNQDEDIRRTGDDVVQTADADDVGDDEDDDDPRGRSIGKHPDHERNEPPGKDCTQDDRPESLANVSGGNVDHGALNSRLEEVSAGDQQSEEKCAGDIGGQDDGPETQNFHDHLKIFVQEEGKDDGEGVLCEKLLAAEDDDQKAEGITGAGDERAPRRVGKIRGEGSFGEQRETHGESGGQGGPSQSDGVTLELFLAFETDSFIDDFGPDGDAFLNFLSFGDRGDGALWIVDDCFRFFGGCRHAWVLDETLALIRVRICRVIDVGRGR